MPRSSRMCQYSCAAATRAVVTATVRSPVRYTFREPIASMSRPDMGAKSRREAAKMDTTAPAAAMDTSKLTANCGMIGAMRP